ncbi:MAG: hypothetical protein ACPG3V_05230 [Porticoccaceae bacterium]
MSAAVAKLSIVLSTVLCTVLFTAAVWANPLLGVWKLEQQPVWMTIQLNQNETPEAVISRNDHKPETVGHLLIKQLEQQQSATNQWRGRIWVERLGEYRNADLKLADTSVLEIRVKVGFISQTVTWQKYNPAEALQ